MVRTLSALLITFVAVLAAASANAQFVQWKIADGGNGHWYAAFPNSNGLNWNMAEQLADEAGGYLATIGSAEENAFVFALVDSPEFFSSFNGSGPALGGFQPPGSPEPGGGWSWLTGEPWTYTNWGPTSPNDGSASGENRLHFFSDVSSLPAPTWNDILDSDFNLGGYVVEKLTPEPSSLALALIAGTAWRRRYRRR